MERAYWDGIQGSYKILINSFYGYLGYAHANFNDYNAARLVTEKGQEIILKAVHLLEDLHAKILEVDTDGAYFVVPPGVDGVEEEIRLVERVSSALPEGINLSHDGRFLGMISLKAKNYVLLDHGGRLIVKGSSLRSRRDEPVFRDLIPQMAGLLIRGNYEEARPDLLRPGRTHPGRKHRGRGFLSVREHHGENLHKSQSQAAGPRR